MEKVATYIRRDKPRRIKEVIKIPVKSVKKERLKDSLVKDRRSRQAAKD